MKRHPVKIKISELRKKIRKIILEEPSITNDPTDKKSFYDYEIERGTDVHSFWSLSPGRSQGTEGDPFRPEDPKEYIGLKTKDKKPEENADSENLDKTTSPADLEDLSPL